MSEYLKDFRLYVFNVPLYPLIQLACNIYIYNRFQNWASGTWEQTWRAVIKGLNWDRSKDMDSFVSVI